MGPVAQDSVWVVISLVHRFVPWVLVVLVRILACRGEILPLGLILLLPDGRPLPLLSDELPSKSERVRIHSLFTHCSLLRYVVQARPIGLPRLELGIVLLDL